MPGRSPGTRRSGLGRSPRVAALPEPGIGGYDYPRGPYGATGFPGSTPAALRRLSAHTQTQEGRRDRQLTTTQIWARDTGPEFVDPTPVMVPEPEPSEGHIRFRPGTQPEPGNRFYRRNGTPRQPRARQMRSTKPEHRMIPDIGANAPGSQNVRNKVAQRYKAKPEIVRGYRPAANPGKTGAHLTGGSQYHPGQPVYGDPEGGPIPGMPFNPDGTPPQVFVQSRFTEHEGGAQEGYAVNRPPMLAKGGTYGSFRFASEGYNPHIRGGRLTGQRYFGAIRDQQRIGAETVWPRKDAYGIKRARGPNHRPVRFEVPEPHTANYYDVPPNEGTAAPDMIHRAQVGGRRHLIARGKRRG